MLGLSANSFTFNPASGPVYAGTARPQKAITLVPEYEGALITADGAANSGTMTSDFCAASVGVGTLPAINTAVCATSGDVHNYYSWTSTSAIQDYDVWIRWQIPSNWGGFISSTTIQIYGWRTDAGNTVTVSLFNSAGTQCGTSTNVATGTAVWTQTALGGDESACSFTAGTVATWRIQLAMDTANDFVRVGEISFSYNATY